MASQDSRSPVTKPKRPGLVHRHSAYASTTSQSPSESGHGRAYSTGHHKPQRHVVGHGHRMHRNPSFGRNLSKANLAKLTAAHQKEEDEVDSGRHHRRSQSGGSIPQSSLAPSVVKPGQSMKRTATVAHLPRNTSHISLKKNHSHGQLTRLGSSRHVNKSKPELKRSYSHPAKVRSKSPAPGPKKSAVHFDVGDEDEGEEMEGVDDQWTEDSASASPNTTRDNTRSNTRQNSVILDPEGNPYRRRDQQPPDVAVVSEPASPGTSQIPSTINKQDFAVSEPPSEPVTNPSSYKSHTHSRPPDANAITKRILEQTPQSNAPPQLTSVTALSHAPSSNPQSLNHRTTYSTATSAGTSTPLVSRFIGTDGTDSNYATPANQSAFLQYARTGSNESGLTAAQRNRSAPNFGAPAPTSPSSDAGSGVVTPGGGLQPSRTQQKLWLQRGLSNIEANSQQYAPPVKGGYIGADGIGLTRRIELVEKEYVVVRRFRHPVAEAAQRLRKLGLMSQRGKIETKVNGTSGQEGPKKSASVKDLKEGKRPETNRAMTSDGRKPKVSFAMTPDEERSPADEETPLEIARRLWDRTELMQGGDE